MEEFDIPYGHLVYFTATFGIFCGNVVFSPLLVYCTKKNLATLMQDRHHLKKVMTSSDKNPAPESRFSIAEVPDQISRIFFGGKPEPSFSG
jgi:hypothetical protein